MAHMDCIDPEVGEQLHSAMTATLADNVIEYSYNPAALSGLMLHWKSCPPCRYECPDAPIAIQQVRLELEKEAKNSLRRLRHEFLGTTHALLARIADIRAAYAEILARLSVSCEDVRGALAFVVGEQAESDLVDDGGGPPIQKDVLVFIQSLDQETREFVIANILADRLFFSVPLSEASSTPDQSKTLIDLEQLLLRADEWLDKDKRTEKLKSKILMSAARPDVLYQMLEATARACAGESFLQLGIQRSQPPDVSPDWSLIQQSFEEFRRDFEDFGDSIKAGQSEILRQYDCNSRSAQSYEPYIIDQLGEGLYNRLGADTKRALQIAEYLRDKNREEDAFQGPH